MSGREGFQVTVLSWNSESKEIPGHVLEAELVDREWGEGEEQWRIIEEFGMQCHFVRLEDLREGSGGSGIYGLSL